MDQVKMGNALKTLRKEKGLTQEELAEMFYVTDRSVSRWETGSSLPDISILIQLADFYGVDIREILDGKIDKENMKNDVKDVAVKVANYDKERADKFVKRLSYLFLISLLGASIWLIFEVAGLNEKPLFDFISSVCLGCCFGMVGVGFLLTSGRLQKFKEMKERLLNKDK